MSRFRSDLNTEFTRAALRLRTHLTIDHMMPPAAAQNLKLDELLAAHDQSPNRNGHEHAV